MSRIATPDIADTPAASQPLLEGVKKQLGVVPNLFRVIGNSPAALQGHLDLHGALSKGTLSAATRERIAIASAHTYIGKNLLRLDDAELAANRDGASNDPKADAAVRFAATVVRKRGRVNDNDIHAVKLAGYDDAAVVEIVQNVALNIWTNYLNEVAQTDIDFPVVNTGKVDLPLRTRS
jgi:alkylhydroperoxidase family enzyme